MINFSPSSPRFSPVRFEASWQRRLSTDPVSPHRLLPASLPPLPASLQRAHASVPRRRAFRRARPATLLPLPTSLRLRHDTLPHRRASRQLPLATHLFVPAPAPDLKLLLTLELRADLTSLQSHLAFNVASISSSCCDWRRFAVVLVRCLPSPSLFEPTANPLCFERTGQRVPPSRRRPLEIHQHLVRAPSRATRARRAGTVERRETK